MGPFDKISIEGLTSFAPGKALTLKGTRPDGSTYSFPVNHTFNENQVRCCNASFTGYWPGCLAGWTPGWLRLPL